jgi:MoxR-like ATPase
MAEFEVFKSKRKPTGWPAESPAAPPWRRFVAAGDRASAGDGEGQQAYRGRTYCPTAEEVLAVNAAIHLRRPLLLTGNPGCGKSSLAYAIAWRLKLGEVLYWSINSQTTVRDGLYRYDAISRLRDANLRKLDVIKTEECVGEYLSLGPLGTALAPRRKGDNRPRVLLIDELDKSDVDLPNDLLDLFEEACFDIEELARIKTQQPVVTLQTAYQKTVERNERVQVAGGHVQCEQFPIVVITSNQERQFPPAFLRRCLRHHVEDADAEQLGQIVEQHGLKDADGLVARFAKDRKDGKLTANDQLLSALFLLNRPECESKEELLNLVLRDLKE